MGKTSKIIAIIILIIIFIVFLLLRYNPKICCNNTCFKIEIADTPESRQLGLMYREYLADNEGMLFVFDKMGNYGFWMKNTLIPLAGIRLDSDLKIVDIIHMDPCTTEQCPSYKPKSEAQYVLEINQSLTDNKLLLSVGDSCKLINSNF